MRRCKVISQSCVPVTSGISTFYLPPGYQSNDYDNDIAKGPLIVGDMHGTVSLPTTLLKPHPDDGMLTCADKASRQDIRIRSEMSYCTWNIFHACNSFDDMTDTDHLVLMELYAAYSNCDIDVSVTFGEAKKNFYAFANSSSTLLTQIRATLLLQLCESNILCSTRLSMVRLCDLPLSMSEDQMNMFIQLPCNIHPRYDFLLYEVCEIVNFLSGMHLNAREDS